MKVVKRPRSIFFLAEGGSVSDAPCLKTRTSACAMVWCHCMLYSCVFSLLIKMYGFAWPLCCCTFRQIGHLSKSDLLTGRRLDDSGVITQNRMFTVFFSSGARSQATAFTLHGAKEPSNSLELGRGGTCDAYVPKYDLKECCSVVPEKRGCISHRG